MAPAIEQPQRYLFDARLPDGLKMLAYAFSHLAHGIGGAGQQVHRQIPIPGCRPDAQHTANEVLPEPHSAIKTTGRIGFVAVYLLGITAQPVAAGAVGAESTIELAEGHPANQLAAVAPAAEAGNQVNQ